MRGGEWFFKKSGSRKILAEFQGSRSLVFSADFRSRSLDFFRNAVSESRVILRLHDDKVACTVVLDEKSRSRNL